jgi:hypothetical protein
MMRCLLVACALLAAAPLRAAVERECVVSVLTKSGWSPERRSTVHFVTGLELARVTTTLPVELRNVYAVISNGGALPTVLRLDTVLLGVGREFTPDDLARLFDLGNEHLATQFAGEGRTFRWRLRGRAAESRTTAARGARH